MPSIIHNTISQGKPSTINQWNKRKEGRKTLIAQHSVIRSLIPRWQREGGLGFYILILYLLVGTLRLKWVMVCHSAQAGLALDFVEVCIGPTCVGASWSVLFLAPGRYSLPPGDDRLTDRAPTRRCHRHFFHHNLVFFRNHHHQTFSSNYYVQKVLTGNA